LVIPGGVDQGQEEFPLAKENPNFGDRFCGERLSSLNAIPPIGNVLDIGAPPGTGALITTVGKNQDICSK